MTSKTVAQKLLIKPGDRVRLDATEAERALLAPLPESARLIDADADVAVVFVHDRGALLERFATLLETLSATRAVWFCYPKGGRADVNRDVIMRECGAFGWRPISNVAVDDVWSAVRLRPLREDEEPAVPGR